MLLFERCCLVPLRPKYWPDVLASVITKGGIGGGPYGGGGIGTNELPDALTWLIHELRSFKKDWSTTCFPSLSSL